MNITIHANSQFDQAFSSFNPIVSISSNIQPPAASLLDGGLIINPNINLEGYINANNDVLNGIVVNANNPNITISGGYPDDPSAGGLIQYPDYSGTGFAGSQIRSDNAAITVDGIRVTGTTPYQIVAATGSIVENCVVDTIGGHPTLLNDQTNAEFSLTHGPTITIDVLAGDGVLSAAEAHHPLIITGSSTGADGQTVTVALDGDHYIDTIASDGTWSVTVPKSALRSSALPDGSYTVTANVSDQYGNAAQEATQTLIVDEKQHGTLAKLAGFTFQDLNEVVHGVAQPTNHVLDVSESQLIASFVGTSAASTDTLAVHASDATAVLAKNLPITSSDVVIDPLVQAIAGTQLGGNNSVGLSNVLPTSEDMPWHQHTLAGSTA
jgi:Bacterial Ig-like domain